MITEQIEKIKNTPPSCIAEILGCSLSQARRFKRGASGLSNRQALYLKEYLGLSPNAFNEIYIDFKKSITEVILF